MWGKGEQGYVCFTDKEAGEWWQLGKLAKTIQERTEEPDTSPGLCGLGPGAQLLTWLLSVD